MKKIAITGGSGRFGTVLKNQVSKYLMFFPSKKELDILDEFHKMKIEGKQLTPIVELDAANKKHFYAPIIMKPNCLVCHGTINETVNIKTDSIIKSLYPNDKAIGYAEGDLRGIWSITFKN